MALPVRLLPGSLHLLSPRLGMERQERCAGQPLDILPSLSFHRIGATSGLRDSAWPVPCAPLPRGSIPGLLALHRDPVSLW